MDATVSKIYDPDQLYPGRRRRRRIWRQNRHFGPQHLREQGLHQPRRRVWRLRTNPNKEQVAEDASRLQEMETWPCVTGEKNGVTYKKLDADSINDRTNAVNRVNQHTVRRWRSGSGEVSCIRTEDLDISMERNTRDVVAAVERNCFQQSLMQNAMPRWSTFQGDAKGYVSGRPRPSLTPIPIKNKYRPQIPNGSSLKEHDNCSLSGRMRPLLP
jgi:hypothetical protein